MKQVTIEDAKFIAQLPPSPNGWEMRPYGTGVLCLCPDHEPRYVDTNGNLTVLKAEPGAVNFIKV